MIGGYGQLSYGFNYYGPTGNQRDMTIVARKLKEGGLKIKAQVSMVQIWTSVWAVIHALLLVK